MRRGRARRLTPVLHREPRDPAELPLVGRDDHRACRERRRGDNHVGGADGLRSESVADARVLHCRGAPEAEHGDLPEQPIHLHAVALRGARVERPEVQFGNRHRADTHVIRRQQSEPLRHTVAAPEHIDDGVRIQDVTRAHEPERKRLAARASSSGDIGGSWPGSKSGVTRPNDVKNPGGQRRLAFGSMITRSPAPR